MKSNRMQTLAVTLALAAPLIYAADANDHDAHHPDNAPAASTPKSPSKPASSARPSNEQAMKMDAQMKTMREMHDRMMNAKTPEERNALMADHMKAMKDGMAMMSGMSGGGMMGSGRMGSSGNGSQPAAPQAMQQQMNMMQKQMDMMQTMMQMMMDRMEMPMPAK